MRTLLVSVLLSLLCSQLAVADTPPVEANDTDSTSIDEVVVSGEQPGPPLWKITKGDNVMFVLGTIVPLPKKVVWRSKEVESVIERAKLIIATETVSTNIGFFRGMRLLPAAMRARKNPDGAELKDVLTPHDYARWQHLKSMY